MKRSFKEHIRTAIAVATALAIGIAFMPLNAAPSHASSFSTSGYVKNIRVTSYTGTSVTLKWDAYSSATGYEIRKATSRNGKYTLIKELKSTSFKRTGLTTNKTCYYKVRAYYKKSDGSFSYSKNSAIVKGTPIRFVDGYVKNLRVTNTTYNTVSLSWDAYPEAKGYKIYKSTSKNGKYVKVAKVNGKTSFCRKNLTTNKTCYYKVRAYKKNKKGKKIHTHYSSKVTGTPRLKIPELSISSSSSGIRVSWCGIKGATGYQVYRAKSQNGSYKKVCQTSDRVFTDPNIYKNRKYYYKVRAYRKIKGDKKVGSFSSKRIGMKISLDKVWGVTADSKSRCVEVDWKPVDGASGYEVYRASGSNKNNYTRVATVKSSYLNDHNVAYKVTYYYKIRAFKDFNGSRAYGNFSTAGYSRSAVVSAAVAWLGCKESNRSNKPIIDLYNSNMGTRFSYTTPWCAMFVSAVAIKTNTTSIIVRGSYCPAVISVYKNSNIRNYSYGAGSSYKPKAGDVIFFDWNRNGVPDHTGLVASVSGNTIKTIEGNYHDAVGYRTFSVGYGYVLGYGLPNYDDANGIVYTGKSNTSVGCSELSEKGIGTEPEGYEELGSEFDTAEQNVDEDLDEEENATEYEKMECMIDKVRDSAETEGIDCSETQYYAAFIYKLCVEEEMESSIMTVEDEDGVIHAWVEVCLDGSWYKVDASKESDQIEEFTPESTDVEGEAVESTEEEMDKGLEEIEDEGEIIEPDEQEVDDDAYFDETEADDADEADADEADAEDTDEAEDDNAEEAE